MEMHGNKHILWICMLCFSYLGMAAGQQRPSEEINKLLKNDTLKLWPGYDNDGKAVDVSIGVQINSIYNLNPYDQTFAISCYLRLGWNDPRISYPEEVGTINLQLGDIQHKLWIPDIFMRNAIETNAHSTLVAESGLRLKPSGDIWLVIKKTVTLGCPMKLHRFPFDTQRCSMFLETFFGNYDSIRLAWKHWDIESGLNVPGYSLEVRSSSYIVNYTTGRFQTMNLAFTFQRQPGHYVVYWFLPTMAITGLSYLQFWLPDDALAAKTTFGCFWYLAFILVMLVSQTDIPKVPQVTALDVWFLVHLLFMTLSIMEVILLHLVKRNRAAKTCGSDEDTDPVRSRVPPARQMGRVMALLTWVLRLAYPAGYILFLVLYWGLYSS